MRVCNNVLTMKWHSSSCRKRSQHKPHDWLLPSHLFWIIWYGVKTLLPSLPRMVTELKPSKTWDFGVWFSNQKPQIKIQSYLLVFCPYLQVTFTMIYESFNSKISSSWLFEQEQNFCPDGDAWWSPPESLTTAPKVIQLAILSSSAMITLFSNYSLTAFL